MDGQGYISQKFLDSLFTWVGSSNWFLRVFVPENPKGKDYSLEHAIATFAPEHKDEKGKVVFDEVVIHFGVETIPVDLRDWVQLQYDVEGKLVYVKASVAYQFCYKDGRSV